MAVHWGEIKPLHIVQSDWMIDHEAEQTGSHEVLERNRNEEINRPLVGADSSLSGVPRDSRIFSHA